MDEWLTIIVPTHNRAEKLSKCLDSIRKIHQNARIVVGDNSDKCYQDISSIVEKHDAELEDLRDYAGCIGSVFKHLIESSKTDFTLIVEDDDLLVNQVLHQKISSILSRRRISQCISFGFCQVNRDSSSKKRYLCDRNQLKSYKEFPSYWNAKFKFDTVYYKTRSLSRAFQIWIDEDHPERNYDGSSDEAIALIAFQLDSKIPIHFPEIGLEITKDHTNESLTNPYLMAYSSRSYISEVGKIAKLTKMQMQRWQEIQLNEIQDDLPNLDSNFLYGGSLDGIAREVKLMMASNCDTSSIKRFIVDQTKAKLERFR